MANPPVYLPANAVYRKMRTIKRTDRRLRPLLDPQALPPAGWCSRCGGEIYGMGKDYCCRCERDD